VRFGSLNLRKYGGFEILLGMELQTNVDPFFME